RWTPTARRAAIRRSWGRSRWRVRSWSSLLIVIPAQAGTSVLASVRRARSASCRCGSRWVPACAGMTAENLCRELLHIVFVHFQPARLVLLPAFAQRAARRVVGGDDFEHAFEAAFHR